MTKTLKWYGAMGIDETIDDMPINRYEAVKKAPIVQEAAVIEPVRAVASATRMTSPTAAAQNTKEIASKCKTREELEAVVRGFKDLSICKTATNTVFCDGNPQSEIMFIGEAPGAEEDVQGIPFCGASGKMLDQMLHYIGLHRADNFYITNTLFWRPPGNRRPTPEELAICRPFVEKHIALVKPKLIVLVGGTAITSVLQSKDGITKLRGKFFDYSNEFMDAPTKVTAIFHPSYLLRSPGQKAVAWKDALMIKHYIKDNRIKI